MAVSAAVVSSPLLGSRSLITLTRSKRFLRLASAGTPLVPIGASRRCMVRRAGNSSYSPLTSGSRGGAGFSDRPPTEMPPLFPGCDYEHWLIVMDKPGGEGATKQQMIDCYVQTLAKVVGSVLFSFRGFSFVLVRRKRKGGFTMYPVSATLGLDAKSMRKHLTSSKIWLYGHMLV
ncbi:DAG protein [Musa troglodytarum]|uniref:DAG protein n=1 Tax=Musa troglodytarum TaxID=320322 RepID=A0A9E7F7T1_9LILI|nr:DAG protein [Musa troglodytarum]